MYRRSKGNDNDMIEKCGRNITTKQRQNNSVCQRLVLQLLIWPLFLPSVVFLLFAKNSRNVTEKYKREYQFVKRRCFEENKKKITRNKEKLLFLCCFLKEIQHDLKIGQEKKMIELNCYFLAILENNGK